MDIENIGNRAMREGLLSPIISNIGNRAMQEQKVSGLLENELPTAKRFINYIKLKEGKPYLKATMPTEDPNDLLTIGWGHTEGVEEGQEITLEKAEQYLLEDIEPRLKEMQKQIPQFKYFPIDVQIPLMYSMFRGSFMQSDKTRRLIKAGKYKEAAAEWLDSDEYRGALEKDSKKPGVALNDFIPTRDALLRLVNNP